MAIRCLLPNAQFLRRKHGKPVFLLINFNSPQYDPLVLQSHDFLTKRRFWATQVNREWSFCHLWTVISPKCRENRLCKCEDILQYKSGSVKVWTGKRSQFLLTCVVQKRGPLLINSLKSWEILPWHHWDPAVFKTDSWIIISGGTPYPTIESKELFRLLKNGYRMEKPDTCNKEL